MRGKLTCKFCRRAEDAVFGSDKEAISDVLMALVWLKERFLSGLLGDMPESWAYKVCHHNLQMAWEHSKALPYMDEKSSVHTS